MIFLYAAGTPELKGFGIAGAVLIAFEYGESKLVGIKAQIFLGS